MAPRSARLSLSLSVVLIVRPGDTSTIYVSYFEFSFRAAEEHSGSAEPRATYEYRYQRENGERTENMQEFHRKIENVPNAGRRGWFVSSCFQVDTPLTHSVLRACYHDEDAIHGCGCAGNGARPAFVCARSARRQRL